MLAWPRIAERKKNDLFDTVIDVDDLKKEISKEELLALFAPPNGGTKN
jgi:hypothetical protein